MRDRSASMEAFRAELADDGFFGAEEEEEEHNVPACLPPPTRPQSAWLLFNSALTAAITDEIEAHVSEESEKAFWAKAKIPVFYDAPSPAYQKWLVRAPVSYAHHCGLCVLCDGPFLAEPFVKGCCDDHNAHVDCWAAVRVHAPDVPCLGTMRSPCANGPVETLTAAEKRALDAKVLAKLSSESIQEAASEDAQRRKRIRTEKHTMAADSIAEWTIDDEDEVMKATPMCRVSKNDKGGGNCVVCGESTKNGPVYNTCLRHKTHPKCYVYYVALRERNEWKRRIILECPSTLFHNADCKKSLRLPTTTTLTCS